jgi:hypothetical protein
MKRSVMTSDFKLNGRRPELFDPNPRPPAAQRDIIAEHFPAAFDLRP